MLVLVGVVFDQCVDVDVVVVDDRERVVFD